MNNLIDDNIYYTLSPLKTEWKIAPKLLSYYKNDKRVYKVYYYVVENSLDHETLFTSSTQEKLIESINCYIDFLVENVD